MKILSILIASLILTSCATRINSIPEDSYATSSDSTKNRAVASLSDLIKARDGCIEWEVEDVNELLLSTKVDNLVKAELWRVSQCAKTENYKMLFINKNGIEVVEAQLLSD